MKQMDNRQKQQIQLRAQKPSRGSKHGASEHKEKNIHGQTSAAGTVASSSEVSAPNQEQVSAPKIGRNDSCPCGSGQKYKKCCLK